MTAKTWGELRSKLHEAEIKEIIEFLWESQDDDWIPEGATSFNGNEPLVLKACGVTS